ncbi:glycosyltransferase [Candidatus Woesearchaeota archaeon]|nr:glycosyltransferase [Candidatus Woesearchaeota archaeon]
MNPKVLVGCPTWEGKKYCLKEYAEALKKLTYDNFDVLIVDNSKESGYANMIEALGFKVIRNEWHDSARERIKQSRNKIRAYALENGYDYFLSLEQDVIPEQDVIQNLLCHQKKIVSGIVYNNLPVGSKIELMPMAYVEHPVDPTGLWYLPKQDLEKAQLVELKACSFSCVLIHRDVLEKIEFRYEEGFDDMMFSLDAINAGFKIYADTSVVPKHLHGSWDGIEK